ncbi:unnamed protein product [Effrenium voratum]|nr:unnamed protein product [Effrenium voratum]
MPWLSACRPVGVLAGQWRCSAFVPRRSADSLQRGFQRLRALQGKLEWPRLTHFSAFGQQYQLPLSKEETRLSATTSEATIQYLSGFFDGDGCVSPQRSRGTCSLVVGQVASNAEVLMRFRDVFGGAIHRASNGQGLRRPTIKWTISGPEGQKAAAALARASIVKYEQLLIALKWPSSYESRISACQELKRLKMSRLGPRDVHCTWAYVAGFFDAEGCIQLRASDAHMDLVMVQRHDDVLPKIRRFLQDVCSSELVVRRTSRGFNRLSVNARDDVIVVLQRLLSSGLLQKKDQADAALTLQHTSHRHVRDSLAAVKGNQMRYARLDFEGCERARAITAVRNRLWRLQSQGKVDKALEEQLDKLRQEHGILNLRRAYGLLRADIRMGLAAGALITSHT